MSHDPAAQPRMERFDAFYRSTRREVLLQALALTGDRPAAEAAVIHAYTSAWKHWRRVSRLDDPLTWVRPRAWKHAQRRHAARPWNRTAKHVTDEQREILDHLGRLSQPQRRALLLVELAGVAPEPAAAELGTTAQELRDDHAAARSVVGTALDLPEAGPGPRILSLHRLLDAVTLPRATRIRRTGRTWRRRRLAGAAAVATVLTVAVGAFAAQPQDTQSRELGLVTPSSPTPEADPTATMPTASDLLYAEQMSRFGPSRTWHTTRTGNNTTGDGLNTVCQQARFADPQGYTALVRGFRAEGSPARTAFQTVEVSRTARAASRAFRTTVGWYASCQVARLQVLSAYHVDHVGDQADVLTLRIGDDPGRLISVAVARTGSVITSTVGTSDGGAPPPVKMVTQSLSEAVKKLCARTGSPGCVGTPTFRAVPPPPTGDEKGLLAAADLPPVGRIDKPWVGTKPATPSKNPAATTCDEAGFAGAGATKRRSRTYLIPQAESVPARFGLTEVYGQFRTTKAASSFLAGVRSRVSGCEKRDLATKVLSSASHRESTSDRSAWRLATKVSDSETVELRVGFVQVGRRVAQVTFAPSPSDDMTDRSFDGVLQRSGVRLRELR